MNKWLTVFLYYLGAFVFGAFLTCAFAPYEVFPLAILALALLLLMLQDKSPRHALSLGFVFGLGFFSTGIYWIFHSVHVFGGVPAPLATLVTGILVSIMALFPATVCYYTNRYFLTTDTTKTLFAFPALWVFSEWARSWLFTGFPWLFVGYSQTNSPLRGFAPILSVYGVSLAVLLTSGALANAISNLRRKAYQATYFNLFLIVSIWTAGGLLTLIPWTHQEGNATSIALIQGNIPQSLKWSPEHLELSLNRYESLTEENLGKNKLIIWPEAAVPLALQDAKEYINELDEKARATGSQIILGIPIQNTDGTGYYNAIVTLGAERAFYIKRRLVPFGEYIPSTPFFSSLFHFMDIPVSNMLPGNPRQAPLILDGVKILTSICYEIAFPELIHTRDPSIGFLLTITNDAWFGDSSAQAQHLQMAKMRAMELGRPVVFVSNDGITAIINPEGKIEAAAPQHEVYVLRGNVQPMAGLTPWMKNGIDSVLFILFCLFLNAIIRTKKILKNAVEDSANKIITDKSI